MKLGMHFYIKSIQMYKQMVLLDFNQNGGGLIFTDF